MPINIINDHNDDQRDDQRPAPYHGERAADLIYDTTAGRRFRSAADGDDGDGAWIYPASYDDFWLARRRAESLARGWGLPFSIDLFGFGFARGAAGGADGEPGEVTTSAAVSEPGYYAYTLADPRPHVIVIAVRATAEEEN